MVADHLIRLGWTVLNRNFRSGRAEIDLVAIRDGVVAFVEVKARSRTDFGHPFETIGRRKRGAVRAAASAWLTAFGSETYTYRFDAAAVTRAADGSAGIELIEDAWRE